MIRLSAAVLTAILLFAAPALAGDATDGAIKLAQADDQPMVITPHPRGEQLPPPSSDPGGPGVPYEPAPGASAPPPGSQAYVPPPSNGRGTFSAEEIKTAGHRFFGSVSKGLASAIEYTFQRALAGRTAIFSARKRGRHHRRTALRRGGALHQRRGRASPLLARPSGRLRPRRRGLQDHGPCLQSPGPREIYSAFAGVDGSAYLVGGVGVTFLADSHVILAPIRSGLGLRLGANIGYLKYTREPTWNPF